MNQEENKRTEEVVDSTDYITAIKELKENSVDRSKYEALKADNKRLLEAVVNGQTVEQQVVKPQVDIDGLRKDLFNNDNLTNLQYAEKALQLRNALIEKGEPDPFLPHGSKILPDANDMECAERMANILQKCVDYAEGDSEVFTNELQRRCIDSAPTIRKR